MQRGTCQRTGASASGSLGVDATTASPPRLPKPKAKPTPKHLGLPTSCWLPSCWEFLGLGVPLNLGCGSVKTEDMMSGLFDFDLKGCLPVWQLVGDVGWLAGRTA